MTVHQEVSKIGFSSVTCLSSFLYFRINLSLSLSLSLSFAFRVTCGVLGYWQHLATVRVSWRKETTRKGQCADVTSRTHQYRERNRLFGSRVTNVRERSARPTTRRTTIGAGSEEGDAEREARREQAEREVRKEEAEREASDTWSSLLLQSTDL